MTDISHLYVPLTAPEDVIAHLSRGRRHWKARYSAQSLATSWCSSRGIPPRVQAILDHSPVFRDASLVDAFFERCVDLGSAGRPSQTDLMVILRAGDELAVAAVEGKVDEPFGRPVGEWLLENPQTHQPRLEGLCKLLGMSHADGRLKYQLFHRSASAILEAQRYCARKALLLVHSFSTKSSGLTDFSAFMDDLGIKNFAAGKVCGPVLRAGVQFYAAWVTDECGEHASPERFWRNVDDYAQRKRDFADDLLTWAKSRKA